MDRGAHGFACGAHETGPAKFELVVVGFSLDVQRANELVDYLVDTFHHCVRLGVTGCNNLLGDSVVAFFSIAETSAWNSLPLSMTTSVGHGWRVSHVIWSQLATSSAL